MLGTMDPPRSTKSGGKPFPSNASGDGVCGVSGIVAKCDGRHGNRDDLFS